MDDLTTLHEKGIVSNSDDIKQMLSHIFSGRKSVQAPVVRQEPQRAIPAPTKQKPSSEPSSPCPPVHVHTAPLITIETELPPPPPPLMKKAPPPPPLPPAVPPCPDDPPKTILLHTPMESLIESMKSDLSQLASRVEALEADPVQPPPSQTRKRRMKLPSVQKPAKTSNVIQIEKSRERKREVA